MGARRTASRRRSTFRRRRTIFGLGALIALLLAAALLLLPGFCGAQQTGQRSEDGNPAEQTERREAGGETTRERETSGSAEREPTGVLVPVAHLTSPRESVTMDELSQAEGLAVPEGSSETAGELLGNTEGFQTLGSASEVVDQVSRDPEAVGLVPWDAVNPRVKALAVDDRSVFAVDGSGAEGYPLASDDASIPDQAELRRVVMGGDIVLDRGQNYAVIQQGLGIDFPLAGGYAAITSRTAEESQYSETGIIHQFTAERRGEEGAVREYLNGADLTLANFENPVVEAATYHPEETTFTGDLRLLPIVENAGIDGVTLGNNHVLDAGTEGLEETMSHLRNAGIEYTGAGMNLDEAREPMVFDLDGLKVGVVSYQGVPSYDWAWATEDAPGTAPLTEEVLREDIERLRPEVDVLVVMPHWGKEYTATPEPGQVELARAAIDAGADLFVGGHAHWPKGMEVYEGKPIYYGVGNFLFDQSWSEETSTGIFAEATLYGDRVVQTRALPFVLLDYAQPNFLVSEEGGDRALRKIFSASLGPEFESYNAERE